MPRPRRVAVIGAGHYHTTYYPHYINLLCDNKLDLVGVHDPDAAFVEDVANRFDSIPYTDYKRMVEETRPDFIVALGRHADMPAALRYLIDARIPFLMEKPWGVDRTVATLARLAQQRGVWAAAPFPMRYSTWAQTAKSMYERGELGAVSHGLYRMVRPGVQRYLDQGCPWMLTKAGAGGGVLLNLGVHGFDLCRWLTGEEPVVVAAVTSHAVCRLEVEDYAFVTLRTPSGVIFHTEVGYTVPTNGADDERKLAAEKALLRGVGTGVHVVTPDRDETLAAPEGHVEGWARVVKECIDRLERGEGPPATADDLARAVSLVFDAYDMAGET